MISKFMSLSCELKSGSLTYLKENFCQIKIFPSLVGKNTTICLSGV